MEIAEDFAERLTAIAESTPRNALENLLMGLMPRVAVQTRPVDVDDHGRPVRQPMTNAQKNWADRHDKLRSPRTRKPRSGTYEVLQPYASVGHRAGTWRHAMVAAATRSCAEDDEDDEKLHSTQAKALAWLKENYPHHYAKGIDFSWCASVGYIKL